MLSKGLFIKIKNMLLKAQVHFPTFSRTVYERVKNELSMGQYLKYCLIFVQFITIDLIELKIGI